MLAILCFPADCGGERARPSQHKPWGLLQATTGREGPFLQLMGTGDGGVFAVLPHLLTNKGAPTPDWIPPMESQVQDGAKVLQEGCLPNKVPPREWTVQEVCAWLSARHGDLAPLASEHAVTGRALLRVTEGTLQRMGVAPCSRRWELLQELLGLRLQQELKELLCIVGGEQHPQHHGDVPTAGPTSPPSPE